jgi:hypothetical protein
MEHNTMNRSAISHPSASARAASLPAKLLPTILAGLCSLGLLAPAHAADAVPAALPAALPPVIAPLWYGSSVDMGAGMARFSIGFDRRPDLLTVDAFARQADSFQFWTDTRSRDPIADTYAALAGSVPLGTQSVVTAVEIPGTGKMATVWPQDATYAGPRDSGGWGIVEGRSSYTLGLDNVLSFDVPLALLHAADGVFAYGFETYQYGGWDGVDYFGVSGKDYLISCVPEPSAPLLMGAGLLALGAFARRRAPARARV